MKSTRVDQNELLERWSKLTPAKRLLFAMRLSGRAPKPVEHSRIPKRPDTEIAPLTLAQASMWQLDWTLPGTHFLNMPYAVSLTGPLDIAALEHSLNEIVRRHATLRTVFSERKERLVQIINPPVSTKLEVTDLRDRTHEERLSVAARLINEEALRPFNLSQGLMMRAGLLLLGEQEYILLLTFHHICFDAVSAQIFNRELGAIYEAFLLNGPSPLPELPVEYADYAQWEHDNLEAELQAELPYWRQKLSGSLQVQSVPTDKQRLPVPYLRNKRQTIVLPESLASDLRRLCRAADLSLFILLLATFKILLFRLTGQEDIRVGTFVANRHRKDLEGLLGLFYNSLLLRTVLNPKLTIREVIEQVRETCLGAFAHQNTPFGLVVHALEQEGHLNSESLFRVMFIEQKVSMQTLSLHGLRTSLLPGEGDEATELSINTADLIFEMREEGDAILVSFFYKMDLFEAQTISHLLECFQRLLEQVTSRPEQLISELPVP